VGGAKRACGAQLRNYVGENMSDLRKAAHTALEAWDRSRQWPFPTRPDKEFDALRAALAQPEPTRSQQMRDAGYTRRPRQLPEEDEQEPVGWLESPHGAFRANLLYKLEFPSQLLAWSVPLFAAPPQRKPLTEAQVVSALRDADYSIITKGDTAKAMNIARAIERAHKIE